MSKRTLFRNALLLCAPIGLIMLFVSIKSDSSTVADIGFLLLILALIGSFIRVHMNWGKYATWWYIVAYPDKFMPVYIFNRAYVTTLIFTILCGYMSITNIVISGFSWLNPLYFYLSVVFAIFTIGMILANACSYQSWIDILDFIFKSRS